MESKTEGSSAIQQRFKSIDKKIAVKYALIIAAAIIAAVLTAVIKYPKTESINYVNSDATWHTLLTMQAYDETPVSQHRFLPIVSLGGEINKGIPWGATIPDEYGNYYYTSFSPAGYVLPYFFVKLFGLPMNETSLYIFNTLLLAITAVLIGLIVRRLFNDKKYPFLLGLTAAVFYCFIPEVMNSQGIVYWHQSVMQVTLALQLLCFINIAKGKAGKPSVIAFYILCLLNPYIEWTGYVANISYAIGLFAVFRQNKKSALQKSAAVAGLTALSFMLFSLHYLSAVSVDEFSSALEKRFFARSSSAYTSLLDLLNGYVQSFGYVFVLIAALLVLVIIAYKGFGWIKKSAFYSNMPVFFVAFFPVLENVVMKQHAVSYTYDRMKLSFVLILIICDLLYLIFDKISGINLSALPASAAAVLMAVVCVVNMFSFLDSGRCWEVDYRENNKLLADYCTARYTESNSVYGLDTRTVRGYVNLLFERSMYERTTKDSVIQEAKNRNMRYAVTIYVGQFGAWNLYEFDRAEIYDLNTGKTKVVSVSEGYLNTKSF